MLTSVRLLAPFGVLAAFWFNRAAVLELLDRIIGIRFVSVLVLQFSTLTLRLSGAAFLAALLFGIWLVIERRVPRLRRSILYGLSGAMVVLVAVVAFRSVRTGALVALVAAIILALNSIDRTRFASILRSSPAGRYIGMSFYILVGIEFVLPWLYYAWLQSRWRWLPRLRRRWGAAGGAVMMGVGFGLIMPSPVLMRWNQALFLAPQAEVIFGPDYEFWSAFDVSDFVHDALRNRVFFCGDSFETPVVMQLSTREIIDSGIRVSGNQFCELKGDAGLFLSVDPAHGRFVYAPLSDLSDVRQIDLHDLAPGEVFLSAQPLGTYVAVASENVGGVGQAADIRIIDMQRREVVTEIAAHVGYLLIHPTAPIVYVNQFAENAGVRAYDLKTGALLATSQRFGRSDRMAFDPTRNQVLATAPVAGKIFRFDSFDLTLIDSLNTVFGARALAVDAERDLLLVSSFLTNRLDVIDLKSGRSLRRYWLGPWLRDIQIIGGVQALVASRFGVYRLNYLG